MLFHAGIPQKHPKPLGFTTNPDQQKGRSLKWLCCFRSVLSCYKLPYESPEYFYLSLSCYCSKAISQLGQGDVWEMLLRRWESSGNLSNITFLVVCFLVNPTKRVRSAPLFCSVSILPLLVHTVMVYFWQGTFSGTTSSI